MVQNKGDRECWEFPWLSRSEQASIRSWKDAGGEITAELGSSRGGRRSVCTAWNGQDARAGGVKREQATEPRRQEGSGRLDDRDLDSGFLFMGDREPLFK